MEKSSQKSQFKQGVIHQLCLQLIYKHKHMGLRKKFSFQNTIRMIV